MSFADVNALVAAARTACEWVHTDGVPTFEDLGHSARLAIYRTEIDADQPAILQISDVGDCAYVFLDSERVGLLTHEGNRTLALPSGRGLLTVLVEHQNEAADRQRLGAPKGLIGPVSINGEPLHRWSVLPLHLASTDQKSG